MTNPTLILAQIKTRRFDNGKKLTNAQIADRLESELLADRAERAEYLASGDTFSAERLAAYARADQVREDAITVLRAEAPEWTDISTAAYNWLVTGACVAGGPVPLQHGDAV